MYQLGGKMDVDACSSSSFELSTLMLRTGINNITTCTHTHIYIL